MNEPPSSSSSSLSMISSSSSLAVKEEPSSLVNANVSSPSYSHPKEYEANKLLKLLVAQHVHFYGDSSASFDKIIKSLNTHPLLIEQYEKGRTIDNDKSNSHDHAALALKKSDIYSLYEYMLFQNDLHPSTHPEFTPTPAPTPAPTTITPTATATMTTTNQSSSGQISITSTPVPSPKKYITQLAQIMYMDYSEELIEDLAKLETGFKQLASEVDSIQSGAMDDILRAKYKCK